MSLGALVLAALFSGWLIVTIVCQFPQHRVSRFFKRLDYCAVIPTWTFFAPNPAVQDFTLLYRDKDRAGDLTSWKVFDYSPPSPLVRWLWNPGKRRSKVIHDMATVWLLMLDRDPSSDAYLLSVPYLCLLHQASVIPRCEAPVATQIAIASVHSHESEKPAEILVVSPFHRI